VALSLHDALSTGRRGRRRRRGRAALSEINVTPLVDVMLVLLIIFMVSAPLLTSGVPVQLPKTDASAIPDQTKPITVSIQKDGQVYLGDAEVSLDDLPAKVQAAGATPAVAGQPGRAIFVRADGAAPYAVVAQVMSRLSMSGFGSLDLLTDTSGPHARHGADATP
jgi:biopolymer transport protein TolR